VNFGVQSALAILIVGKTLDCFRHDELGYVGQVKGHSRLLGHDELFHVVLLAPLFAFLKAQDGPAFGADHVLRIDHS